MLGTLHGLLQGCIPAWNFSPWNSAVCEVNEVWCLNLRFPFCNLTQPSFCEKQILKNLRELLQFHTIYTFSYNTFTWELCRTWLHYHLSHVYSYCQSRCYQDKAALVLAPTVGRRRPKLDNLETKMEVYDRGAVAPVVIAQWNRWSKRSKREERVLKDQVERLALQNDWTPRTSIMEEWERTKGTRREVNNGSRREREALFIHLRSDEHYSVLILTNNINN